MSRHPAFFPMASSTSWKKTNHRQSQQKAMSDPTAKARRSFADRKTSSRPPPDWQPPRRSVADKESSSGPKPDRQPRRRRIADKESSSGPKPDGQPKTSVADKKNFSGPKPDGQPKTSVADKKNFSGPKPDRQPRRRRIANGKPKTSLFGTDSLQCSALGIHDHCQLAPCKPNSRWVSETHNETRRMVGPCRLCCKTILPVQARKIDSRSGVNAQR